MDTFSLGWNWNPVIFFIVLVVSSVLAATVLKKRQVAWVVPALVLYFGLEWALPYSWLFKTIFWIAVLVAVVTAFRPGVTKFAKVPVGLVLVGLVIAALGSGVNRISGDEPYSAREPSAVPTETCSTWEMQKADYGDTRWFADGIVEIERAKTESEARDALAVWLDRVQQDPLLFKSAAKTLLKKDVTQSNLFDKDECATETAVQYVLDIETVVAKAKVKKVDSAPKGTVSTGVQGDKMVSVPTSGNDAAVKITLEDGTEVWIERDCGNVVTREPIFPPDNPKKKCPPDMPHGTYPVCKDDPSKGPAHNPLFPEQQKPNVLDADPDLFQPTKPADPPATYTAPSPPPPTNGGGGSDDPTPDPTFTPPPPQPSAPPPEDPETGCVVIPDVEDCS